MDAEREELEMALKQARGYEGKLTRFFRPGWWRLRNVLICQYDFSEHLLRPPWTQVLETHFLTKFDNCIASLKTRWTLS